MCERLGPREIRVLPSTFQQEERMPVSTTSRPRLAASSQPDSARGDRLSERRLAALVAAARAGDRAAVATLVEHFDPVVRGIARSYRLQPADVEDVAQAAWIDLLEHLDRIRCPEALGGWLSTVTRRRVMRMLQSGSRELLTEDPRASLRSPDDDPPARLLAAERQSVLADAVAQLPDRPRRMMTVLLADPAIDYSEISKLLSVPIGSIGPTRARSLSRLSRDGRLCALHRADIAA
jgi:RNA polymerase sigma factor (sigma-70 family)